MALGTDGFCTGAGVGKAGPVHLNVAPLILAAFRWSGVPGQTTIALSAAGVGVSIATSTCVLSGKDWHPLTTDDT